jgi:acyl-CoA thioester hydrolase
MSHRDFSGRLTATETLRIPFHDVDAAGVAWHGRYFKYFEAARWKLFDLFDYGYAAMNRSGCLWPVVDASVRYVRPLMLDQQVIVTACLREWEMRLVVDYRVADETGVTYTRARTVQVPVDAESHELMFGSPDVLLQNVRKQIERLD